MGIRIKTLEQKVLPSQVVSPSEVNDFAAEIKRQREKQKKEKDEEEEAKDPLYDFDDEIIHSGHSDEEDDDGKQSQYAGDSMNLEIKHLQSMDDLAGTFDAKQLGSHRRTRTEALRVKLQNLQTELETMSAQSNEKLENVEKNQRERDQALKGKLNGLNGALKSANDELDRAEEQIAEKDEEISNLKRELALSKSMNQEMRDTVSGDTGDDLLKQRMKDANRFAFMLGAMQEQLDFERTQFVKKIHSLELQLEHKDVQLNALFQLYNNIVTQTRQSSKSWWERLTITD